MAGQGDGGRPSSGARAARDATGAVNLCPVRAIQSSALRASVHLTVSAALIVLSVIGLNRLSALAALPPYLSIPAWIVALQPVYLSRLQKSAVPGLFWPIASSV